MVIPEAEYEGMKWDVRNIEGLVCDAHPDLKDRFIEFQHGIGFSAPLTFDKLIRYIVLCYHKESPLVKRRIEIGQRKEQALKEAGFEKETVWQPEIREIISNKNDDVLRMIFQFLKFERHTRYANLMMLYERYWNAMSDTKIKTTESQELLDLIEEQEELVFSGDTKLGNNVAAIQVIDRRYIITPEQNASKVKADRKQEKEKETKELLKRLRSNDD